MDIDPPDVAELLKIDQLAWAQRNERPTNARRTGLANISTALFAPLTDAAREQFAKAPGGELQKMHSFRSSSALAVNVFMPWGDDPTQIAHLLGGSGRYESVAFEQPFATDVSRDPHLDVVLKGGEVLIAVESKFVEPYDDKERSTVAEAYFEKSELWEDMDDLRDMAGRIADGRVAFERLEAAQLVKHALGLAHQLGPHQFKLVYLWYRIPGAKAVQHQEEIDEFVDSVGDSVDLKVLTYQELFFQLVTGEEPAVGYFDYLRSRYFREPT